MKISELSKSKLASFKSGTIIVRYMVTGIVWWGRVEKVEREGDYIKVTTSDDMLQMDIKPPWLTLKDKRHFSFNDTAGEIELRRHGASSELFVKGATKRISIYSASHPNGGRTS